MEQSVAMRQGFGEYSLTFIKPARIPAEQPTTMTANADAFSHASQEARLARYGGESRRAHYYYNEALRAAPEDVGSEALADIFESLNELNQTLAWNQEALPRLRAAVEEDPRNSEKRFHYARMLWSLGCEDEAARQYEAVLEHPESICRECLRDCWNDIGWSLYRKEEFAKALPWFERAAKVKGAGPMGETFECARPFENIIQVYVALHMQEQAIEATVDYITRFGRLPWPERYALRKLNIDADALYVQSCGQAA
jgi:tetratricopeptide (TPR) repeat protein